MQSRHAAGMAGATILRLALNTKYIKYIKYIKKRLSVFHRHLA